MADQGDTYNLVRLTDQQRAELLERLDQPSAEAARLPFHKNRRGEQRWQYRQHDVVVDVQHLGGGSSRFVVLTRNLSVNGMAFIHGGFIHLSTCCHFTLHLAEGGEQKIAGHVVGCRHVEGTLHEVRVHFNESVDPSRFVSSNGDEPGDSATLIAPESLTGHVVYVAESDIDANLIGHYLSDTKVKLDRVHAVEDGIAALQAGTFDLVILDLMLNGETDINAIEKLRHEGYRGRLVVFTGESNPAKIQAAIAAGVDRVINKPINPPQLYSLLTEVHEQTGAMPGEEVIYSSLAGEDMSEMLLKFIEYAAQTSERLEAALNEENLDQVRAACISIKGSAGGYGFAGLGEAANTILDLMDSSGLDACVQELATLASMCRRLALSQT